ncbi:MULTISPECIES: FtsX-like permease family protein [unclassified Rathayibacter]|uniref:FtsX-like permease family protein n=1 Tax=unclassified Rathayibacter TaxID=2609250 RepID=UPI0006F6ACEF|nr:MULTISPECIES: FtsX-like permease family protein [unclassified Rathayibacter]KQQ05887.1 hypothetical protein ASF42_04920 [Rathayibacter sp. Leaf294]KQS13744.1 hypothetical protein ASG06_04930 [Rathayibacter sp. Leaf185]
MTPIAALSGSRRAPCRASPAITRAGSAASSLAALAAVVLAASALLVGVTATVDAGTGAAAQRAVGSAIGGDGAVVVTAETASDSAEQDAAVRQILQQRVPTAQITRSERAGPIGAELDGVPTRVELLAGQELPIDGAQPQQGQVVPQTAATTLTVSGLTLPAAGIWAPRDPLDPRWAGHPASGRDGDAVGPLLVTEQDLRAIAQETTSEWVMTPGGAAIDRLARLTDLERDFAVSGAAGEVTVTGGLAETAAAAARARTAAAGLTAAALLLLVTVVVVGSSRLLALASRRREQGDTLLRARGASRGQLTGWSIGEVAAVAVPAGAIGALLGWGASAALVPGASWQPAGMLGVVALVGALIATAAGQPVPLTRRRSVNPVLVVVLLLAAAAVAVWQLGSAERELGVAGIAAVPLLVVALAGATTTAAAAATRRRRTLGRTARAPWLFVALRSLRSRAAWFTATGLVVVLASALCVAASMLPGAVSEAERSVVVDENGAEVRASFALGPIVAVGDEPLPVAAIPDAAAVLTTAVEVGSEDLTAVVLPAARAEALTGSAFAPTSERPGGLGAEAVAVGVRLTSLGADRPGTLSGTAWLASVDGALAAIDLGTVPVAAGRGALLSGELPSGFGDAELLAIDLRLEGAEAANIALDEVAGLDSAGAPTVIEQARLSRDAFSLSSQQPRARVIVDPTDAPLPVALSASAASLLGLAVGDELDVSRASGRTLAGAVAAIVPVVPGARGARSLAIDTADFARASLDAESSLPTPSEVWVATDDTASVARIVAENADADWTVRGAGSPFLSTGVAVWAVAASTAVLMAFVALAANGAVLRRLRAGDEAALAALGLTVRERRARRLVENGIVGALGIVAGAVIGLVASVLCVPAAAALAAGGSTRPGLSVDPPLLLGLSAALLLAVVGGVVAASRERGIR